MRVSRRCRLPPLRLDAATLTPPVPVYCVLSIEVSCIEVQGIEVKGIEVQGIVRVVPSARARVAAHSCAPSPEGAADRPAPSSTATFKVSVPGRRPAPSLAVWAGGPHCSPLSLSVRLRHPHWHWECRRHAHTRGGSAPTVCSMGVCVCVCPTHAGRSQAAVFPRKAKLWEFFLGYPSKFRVGSQLTRAADFDPRVPVIVADCQTRRGRIRRSPTFAPDLAGSCELSGPTRCRW